MLRKEHHALLATLKRDTKRKRGAFCANGGDGGGVKEGWGAGRERDEEDGKKMAAYMHTF